MSVAVDSICLTPSFGGVGLGGVGDVAGDDEVELGNFVLTPGFKSHLESYYHKATPEDRVKCLDLLTSLRAYEQNQVQQQSRSHLHQHRRPQTAMAALGVSSRRDPHKLMSTYTREYIKRDRPVSGALRPESTNIYGPSSCYTGHPHNESTYAAAFNTKDGDVPSMPIRSGSASGTRNNNPHPLQAFMVWRYPSKPRKKLQTNLLPPGLADELVDKIHSHMCKSTYQVDYLSLKQRREKERLKMTGLPPDWKSALPLGLDSVQRTSYRQFRQTDNLQCPSTRYGSNRTKHIPATGSIPTVNRFLLNLKNKTTYERHFNDTAATVVEQAIEHSKNQDARALLHYYQKATGENKAAAGRILMNNYLNVTLPPRPPSSGPQEPSCCYRRPERPVPSTLPSTARSIRSSSDSQATPPTPTSVAVARAAGRFPKQVASPYCIPESVRFEELI